MSGLDDVSLGDIGKTVTVETGTTTVSGPLRGLGLDYGGQITLEVGGWRLVRPPSRDARSGGPRITVHGDEVFDLERACEVWHDAMSQDWTTPGRWADMPAGTRAQVRHAVRAVLVHAGVVPVEAAAGHVHQWVDVSALDDDAIRYVCTVPGCPTTDRTEPRTPPSDPPG